MSTAVEQLYRARPAPSLVDVPPLLFLTIDGRGDPASSPVFEAAVQALCGVSYALKFALRHRRGIDHRVMPLEGLWSAHGGGPLLDAPREAWEWTLMIAQPEHVDEALLGDAVAAAPSAAARLLRLERFHEGLAVQVLHVGPYSAEEPAIRRLHAFAADAGYALRGRHHEIYLGDPRRSAPERLRTIVRRPVAPG